ncbi:MULTISPECIES: fosfomycin resistance glutathione transferase [unclassified Pantoea]|uniref:fosfomycin resistance glutathione transferase n=1 Tax=unclassified Pantoea TaxID=2630326 RepID=UPI001CD43E16|nr:MULTISPECIES: fosfomycin resistance glutathione transferase [unclassified Pantoea]MCA1179396.1 fosfomycin resistance glutathione transferase [Pantoea sp. alder69]MCA1252599.1 fosfomycin resistance glutathione transferase [Pantoea sp. alder70]MCA1268182.1 fosfomycin resistance glutathione transferase [Pantoea sp. alder81]
MLTGLNHITLAVSNVSESFTFYVETLGFTPRAQWKNGAYLSIGELWLCLSLDAVSIGKDYTHYAFSIEDEVFEAFAERLKASGVKEWKVNKSEGKSLYFLDPDGHKLELHVGSLESRLKACRAQPYEEMKFY